VYLIKTYTEISKIDVLNKDNNIKVTKINLGCLTHATITTLETNDKKILLFRIDCLITLQNFCHKLNGIES